jgi:Fe2+ transport system protein FeoA
MEKNIQSLKSGETGRISRIDGPGLRDRMGRLGLREGVSVERLGLAGLSGCVEIKIDQRRVTLGLGIAMKLRVERDNKSIGLLDMSPGDRVVISSIQGGHRIVEILRRDFAIVPGKAIEFIDQRPDREFLVEVGTKRSTICEGDASKIVVRKGGKTQLNYLNTGDEAPIVAIAAGSRATSMLREFGIEEGRVIRLVQITPGGLREPEAPMRIRVGAQELSIGYGLAEKIWVEEESQKPHLGDELQ